MSREIESRISQLKEVLGRRRQQIIGINGTFENQQSLYKFTRQRTFDGTRTIRREINSPTR